MQNWHLSIDDNIITRWSNKNRLKTTFLIKSLTYSLPQPRQNPVSLCCGGGGGSHGRTGGGRTGGPGGGQTRTVPRGGQPGGGAELEPEHRGGRPSTSAPGMLLPRVVSAAAVVLVPVPVAVVEEVGGGGRGVDPAADGRGGEGAPESGAWGGNAVKKSWIFVNGEKYFTAEVAS